MATIIRDIESAKVDETTGDIQLALKGDSPKPYGLVIKRKCMAKIITLLRYVMQLKREKFPPEKDMSLFSLTGVQSFREERSGNRGLVLILDHGLHVPVLFHAEAVEDFRKRFAHWDDKEQQPSKDVTYH
jgi:hypothetical protein